MPYIHPQARERALKEPRNVGEMNFAVTTLVDEWIANQGLSYTSVNAAIGVLECAKLELYRRIAGPYEDTKIGENGDVYTCNTDTPKG